MNRRDETVILAFQRKFYVGPNFFRRRPKLSGRSGRNHFKVIGNTVILKPLRIGKIIRFLRRVKH
jgi:hypothetical protein